LLKLIEICAYGFDLMAHLLAGGMGPHALLNIVYWYGDKLT